MAEETMLVLTMAPPPAVKKGVCQLPLAPHELPRGRGTKKILKTVELTPKRMTLPGLPCTAPTKEMSATTPVVDAKVAAPGSSSMTTPPGVGAKCQGSGGRW